MMMLTRWVKSDILFKSGAHFNKKHWNLFTISSFSGFDKRPLPVLTGVKSKLLSGSVSEKFRSERQFCNFETTPLIFLVYFVLRGWCGMLSPERNLSWKRKLGLSLSILDEKLGNTGFFSERDERKSTCDILVIKCSASFFIINMSSSTSYDV